MAHFARIDNGYVTQVLVVNNVELDDNGAASEAKGIALCQSLFGEDTHWVQTSYNGNPINGVDRGPFAGIGYAWDGTRFIPPTPQTPVEES